MEFAQVTNGSANNRAYYQRYNARPKSTATSFAGLLDRFYVELKRLEREANSLDRRDALADESLYSTIESLAHRQADRLLDALNTPDEPALVPTLHAHRWHRDLLMQSDFIARALLKPRGYAGDKELMRMIYNNADRGDSNFAVLKNRVYQSLPAAEAVRERMRFLGSLLRDVPDHGRVLNVASGPAAEVREYLATCPSRNVQIDLVDHDIDTIRFTRQTIKDRRVHHLVGNALRIAAGDYLTLSPRPWAERICDPKRDTQGMRKATVPLKYGRHRLDVGTYDLVYSAGLFDYIEHRPGSTRSGAQALTARLFDLVKPGGLLVLGNFLDPSGHRNPHQRSHQLMMEMYSQWHLLYRSPEAIRQFTGLIPSARCSVELVDEYRRPIETGTGAVGMLMIRKVSD